MTNNISIERNTHAHFRAFANQLPPHCPCNQNSETWLFILPEHLASPPAGSFFHWTLTVPSGSITEIFLSSGFLATLRRKTHIPACHSRIPEAMEEDIDYQLVHRESEKSKASIWVINPYMDPMIYHTWNPMGP